MKKVYVILVDSENAETMLYREDPPLGKEAWEMPVLAFSSYEAAEKVQQRLLADAWPDGPPEDCGGEGLWVWIHECEVVADEA